MAGVTLGWIQLTTVAGSLQGLLLTAVLALQRHNRTANRLLAALMAAFTLYLAASFYYDSGLVRVFPQFFGWAYQMPWVFGPLVYLYAVAASDRAWRFRLPALLHFVPAGVNLAAAVPYYLMSGAEKLATYEQLVAGEIAPPLAALDPLKYVSGLGYSVATVLSLRGHRIRVEHSYSNTARVRLTWLLCLTGAAAGIWLLATTLRITDFGTRLRDEHVSLAIALVVYGIGYMGLRQPEVFRYDTAEFAIPNGAAGTAVLPLPEPPRPDASAQRYERSGLGDDEAARLRQSLLAIMDVEHPWKDSELTLADLATRLHSTPHKLSEVLNAQVGQTFYDFVNGYRVREVQRRIKAGEARALKMLALALDAGFTSKSTFNEVFKKHTNQTPSDFRQAVGA